MQKLLILIILLVFGINTFANEKLPFINSRELSKVERITLVNNYKHFMLSIENIEASKKDKIYSTIIFEKILNNILAYANSMDACIYGGWPSARGSSGFCDRPDTRDAYKRFQTIADEYGFSNDVPVGFQKCGSNQRQCNPVVFGPVCIPFDTKYQRVRSTSNCNKESTKVYPRGFDYKQFVEDNIATDDQAELLEYFSGEMDEVQKISSNVCKDPNKKQSKTAVCRVLGQRLAEDFPLSASNRYSSNTSRGSKKSRKTNNNSFDRQSDKPRTEESLVDLENEIVGLNLEINKTLTSKSCTDPSVAKVVNKRYNTIKLMDPDSGEFLSDEGSECISVLKPLLEKRSKKLQDYETLLNDLTPQRNSCVDEDLLEDKNALAKQITEMNSLVAEKACEENPAKWTAKGCGKDFACAIGSSIFMGGAMNKVGSVIGKKLGFDKGCLNSQNNCLSKIATAAADVVWSFLQSIPDIAKMAWEGATWVGKKVYGWMPWVSDTEKKLSEANQAAMNVIQENEESTLEKIGSFFTNMWEMIKEYVTDDLMCNEVGWETERFKKDAHCDAPFVSWNCMTCAGAISGACNVIGAVGSEVIIGILTGGAATGVKAGAKAVSLGVKVGTRMLLKSQIKGLAGVALRTTGKIIVKTKSLARVPFTLAKSSASKAKVFLKSQKGLYRAPSKWVSRNVNKVVTPIISKNQVLRNIAEITVEGTKKLSKKGSKLVSTIVTAPFKLPGKVINVAGRILDPFKLGEKGFAIGFNAMNGLIPMTHFLRVTNFSYDLSNAITKINKAKSAQSAVDLSMDLLSKASGQMNDWVKAAKAGTLTIEEFRQLEKLLELQKSIKTKYAASSKAMERFDNLGAKFDAETQQLFETLGPDQLKRYTKYSQPKYTDLEPNKLRVIGPNTEKNINSIELVKHSSDDILITIKPNNQNVLITDKIDGNYIGLTRSGEEVMLSSGTLSKESNIFINKKLDALTMEQRVAATEKLIGKTSKVKNKIAGVKSSDKVKPLSTKEKITNGIKNKVASIKKPFIDKTNRLSLEKQIKSGTAGNDFEQNVDNLLGNIKTKTSASSPNLNELSKDFKLLDEATSMTSGPFKSKMTKARNEAFKALDTKAKNTISNKLRGPAAEGKFAKDSSNVSIYSKTDASIDKSIKAKVTSKIEDGKVYLRLDKENASEGIRVFDESNNSFIGFNSEGTVVHIKKTALSKADQNIISKSLEELDPKIKDKLSSGSRKSKSNKVYPSSDPDFIYTKQLAKSEIRVGDEIVKLRSFQAASQNLVDNLVDGGTVTLKNNKGISIKINNISERGDYWVGLDAATSQRVLVPKFLMDSKTNKLMSRGRNFTKLKRNFREKLKFIKSYNKADKVVKVDKAFKAKYKYVNYRIKLTMSRRAISEMDQSTLEKISDKVYIRRISEDEAEILYENPVELTEEEQVVQDIALEVAVSNEQEFNFDDLDESDLDF